MSTDLTAVLVYAAGTILLASLLCATYMAGLSLLLPRYEPTSCGCPHCRRGALERVAALPGGDRFYRCDQCGARYTRSSRDGPWRDASAPEYDRAFLRRTREGTWEKPEPPIDEETYWTKTIDTLVWCKRLSGPCQSKRQAPLAQHAHLNLASLWDRELDW
jgi:hypothetical protein